MTGLLERDEVSDVSNSAEATQAMMPIRPAPRGFTPRGWREIGWLTCGFAGSLAIGWFIFLSPGELGTRAEWFFGAAVCGVALVSLWQTSSVQRQARQNADEAVERVRMQLATAEERWARELDLTRTLHRTEIDAQRELHRADMEAQRELARVERAQLRNQLQKQAMIEVSRAVGTHTQKLATLWEQGSDVLDIEDRDERQRLMSPIFDQIGQVVNDFSVELRSARLLIEDDSLHHALKRVSDAALMAVEVAEDLHNAVIEGHAPQPDSITSVQGLLHTRATEARGLAWDLLRTGLEQNSS